MDYQDFAKRIRGKYPGAYDDMDDLALAKKVVDKHPQYSDVTFGKVDEKAAPKEPSMLSNVLEKGPIAAVGESFRKNPDPYLKAVPIAAGIGAGIATGGIGLAPAMAMSGLAGAGAEGFRQIGARMMGREAPATSGEAAKLMLKEGAVQASGEGVGRGVVAGGKMALAGIKKSGPILDAFASFQKGSGQAAINKPEITKPGYFNVGKLKDFVGRLGDSMSKYADEVKASWSNTAKSLDDASGSVGKIDRLEVKSTIQDVKKSLGITSTDGISKASRPDVSAIEQIEESVNRISAPSAANYGRSAHKDMNLRDALELRQKVDDMIDWDSEVPDFAKSKIKEIRVKLDKMISDSYPEIKAQDALYSEMLKKTKDVRKSFGIKRGKAIEDYTTDELKAIESKVLNTLRKGELERDSLKALDDSFTGGFQALKEAEELAASGSLLGKKRQFEKLLRPGVATFGGGLGAGMAAMLNPATLAASVPFLAATSPRLIGAGLRAGKNTIVPTARKAAGSVTPTIKAMSLFGRGEKGPDNKPIPEKKSTEFATRSSVAIPTNLPKTGLSKDLLVYREGLEAFISGDASSAKKLFEDALRLNPENKDAQRALERLSGNTKRPTARQSR